MPLDNEARSETLPGEKLPGGLRRDAGRGGAPAGYWTEAWRRFRRDRLALCALCVIVSLGLMACLAPLIAGVRPIVCSYKGQLYFPFLAYYDERWENPIFFTERFRGNYPVSLRKKDPESWAIWPLIFQDPYQAVRRGDWPDGEGNSVSSPPTRGNLLGTDDEARDVFARILYGGRTALLVGFVSMGIAGLIGITLGALAGYCGGWVDVVVSRLIELALSIPSLVLILATLSIVERPTIYHVMAVIGLTRWESIARLTRAECLRIKEADYVLAARAIGASGPRILLRHVLPNALTPIFVTISFGIAGAVLLESALSFLGLGPPAPHVSWGSILDGWLRGTGQWWLAVFPGLAIFLTVLCYNLIGDGLQEALDPRLRR